jgi:hypothetical protein
MDLLELDSKCDQGYFLLEALQESIPWLFWPLEAACVPWLMIPFPILKVLPFNLSLRDHLLSGSNPLLRIFVIL